MRLHKLLKLFFAVLLCGMAGLASAKLPSPSPEQAAKAEQVKKLAAERARRDAAALGRAQDRVVEHYRTHKLGKAPKPRVAAQRLEKLACKLGSEDRHARIAVELVGGRVKSIAYYSKWKPRTCSVHIVRDDSWSQWKDSGNVTVVTLNEDKGAFLIDHQRRAVKFLFRNIDRERFCGMEGKITGSLTVTRGRDRCELEGVMDEPA
ncbi:MAG: hypothetical protein ACO3F9_10315 [Burkholderiales bacterium]